MTDILLLTRREVQKLLSLSDSITAVENAYSAYIRGETIVPPVVNLLVDIRRGEVDIKSAYMETIELIGIKVASGFWDNPERYGLPTGFATMLLLDGSTGLPLCIMDAGYITTLRTGAAGAVAAKYLSRADAAAVGILGAGTQGRVQLRGLLEIRRIRRVRVYDQLEDRARVYVQDMSNEFPGVDITAARSVREAVQDADIVVTATPSTSALVSNEWIAPGVHINAMGADAPGKQELDPKILTRAKIVVDKLSQCIMIGETQHAFSQGLITVEDIYGEIGELTAGLKPGRVNNEEITLFDATGVAIQDVAVASSVYKQAVEEGLGTGISLM